LKFEAWEYWREERAKTLIGLEGKREMHYVRNRQERGTVQTYRQEKPLPEEGTRRVGSDAKLELEIFPAQLPNSHFMSISS
jgi:hypothetical protein